MAHVFAKTGHHPHMASCTSVGGCCITSKILALFIEIRGRSYDEMMVCYKCKCYNMQHYLPNKPVEWDFKVCIFQFSSLHPSKFSQFINIFHVNFPWLANMSHVFHFLYYMGVVFVLFTTVSLMCMPKLVNKTLGWKVLGKVRLSKVKRHWCWNEWKGWTTKVT